jgi:hypothetical protein
VIVVGLASDDPRGTSEALPTSDARVLFPLLAPVCARAFQCVSMSIQLNTIDLFVPCCVIDPLIDKFLQPDHSLEIRAELLSLVVPGASS